MLVAYYLNGAAVLAWSGFTEKRDLDKKDRALAPPTALAEGTETIVAYVLFFVIPSQLEWLLWGWAGVVFFTVGQRILGTVRALSAEQVPTR